MMVLNLPRLMLVHCHFPTLTLQPSKLLTFLLKKFAQLNRIRKIFHGSWFSDLASLWKERLKKMKMVFYLKNWPRILKAPLFVYSLLHLDSKIKVVAKKENIQVLWPIPTSTFEISIFWSILQKIHRK